MKNQKQLPQPILLSVLALFVLTSLAGCSGNTRAENQLPKLQWLQGRWEMKTDGGLMTETWKPIQNGSLAGESYVVEAGDTVFSETIQLKGTEGEVQYIVTIPGQNKEKPVAFTLVTASENGFVFENLEHDFPQRIIYKKDVKAGLVARIEGKQNGKPVSQEFRMKRVE